MVHLHVHTEYSRLDGACRIKELVAKAAAEGHTALAITDHGYMYGVLEFYSACKKAGIKPILGVELYTAADIHERTKEKGHIILLAKDNVGYANLVKLESVAATDGFYYNPRCDLALLEKYHEGLICLSACISGDIPKLLLAGNYEGAKELAGKYKAIFGDDYYIELQYHGLDNQKMVLPKLISLADELGIKTVATNDVHYIEKGHALAQRVLMCIGMKRLVSDETALGYGMPREFYYKSEAAMREIFDPIAPDAVSETDRIAEKCNVELDLGKSYHLPEFPTPKGEPDNYTYLCKLCRAGLVKRYGADAPKYLDQLNYELETIHKMGFTDYMLIVSDFIWYAKKHKITVGPGRGSAAGSVVAYCLGITTLDPIKYHLKFERFLNPERVTMPDIDVDFAPNGRADVINYVANKYGQDHIAQIITFGTLAAKSAVRDVSKALGMRKATIDRLVGLIPKGVTTIEQAYKSSAALRDLIAKDEDIKLALLVAKQLEGLPRNTSVHAAGVVLAPGAVSDFVPIQKNPNGELPLSQFAMADVERVGALKVDFLAVKTMKVIDDTEKAINAGWPAEEGLDVWSVPLDDSEVYKELAAGNTKGVFQLGSTGIRSVLKKLGPTCFDDLIAVIALYRPGPMDSIPKFIEGKQHPERVTYAHPLLEPILKSTYGIIIYQEQVMEIVRQMAGYSYGRSDLVRRAMSKKKPDVLAAEKDIFINGRDNPDGTIDVEGCLRRGIPRDVAEALWEEMASFASYAFNKSHATAYADVAYRTAYLHRFFPLEYQAAVLTDAMGSTEKLLSYLEDCETRKIKVLPPDINMSMSNFTVEKSSIRFGLAAIRDVGAEIIQDIVTARGDVPYRDMVDLMERCPAASTTGTLTALIKAGALDSFPQNRAQMLALLPSIQKKAAAARNHVLKEQLTIEESFFTGAEDTRRNISLGKVTWPNVPDLSEKEKLDQEMEALSIYLSGNPMAEYQDAIANKITHRLFALTERPDDDADYVLPSGADVRVAGVITQLRQMTTKKDKRSMCALTISDQSGRVDVTVFPKAFEAYGQRLKIGEPVILYGRVEDDDTFGRKLIANAVEFLNPQEDVPA